MSMDFMLCLSKFLQYMIYELDIIWQEILLENWNICNQIEIKLFWEAVYYSTICTIYEYAK